MTEATARIINTTLLWVGSVETFVIATSFRRDTLRNLSDRVFFIKVLIACIMMLIYGIYFYRGSSMNDPTNMILKAVACAGIYAIYYLYLHYLKIQLAELDPGQPVSEALTYLSIIICAVGTVTWILSTFGAGFSELNETMKGMEYFEIGHFGLLLLAIMTFIVLLRHFATLGARHSLVLCSMPLLVAVATFMQPYAKGIELYYPAILTEIIIVYTQHHQDIELQIEVQKEKEEMMESRAKLRMATDRMKPHYLYNVLTSIYYLCESDPKKAQHAVSTFSEYLRDTLETMDRKELVPFSWEIREIKNYLELEKLRFGDRLNIVYDVEVDDFLIPPLSIQPLVENAVKHGVAAKEEGGTVRIATRMIPENGVQIKISDDGAGFNIALLNSKSRRREGLANVRERLRLEVGGVMTIGSTTGKGTEVIVTIKEPITA